MCFFIFESILILFFTPMAAIYSGIAIICSPQKWRRYLPFCILLIGIVAYSYNPLTSADLIRYIEMVERCRDLSVYDTIKYFNDGLIVKNIIFWALSKLDAPHFLPAISSATVYGIAGYITCDTAERWKCEEYIPLLLTCQILLLPFFSITSNIRNVCAFSLIILAAYLDFEKKKRDIIVLVLYVFPCFIHTSAWILLVLRILVVVVKKFKTGVLFLAFFLPVLINLMYQFRGVVLTGSSTVNTIINQSIVKAYWYLNGADSSEFVNLISRSGYEKANRAVIFLLTISFILLIIQCSNKKHENTQITTYMFLLCVTTLAFFTFKFPHYWRFAAAYAVMIGVVLVPILAKWNLQKGRIKFLTYLIAFLALAEQALQIWYSHYGVNYLDLVGDVLINNAFVLIIRILLGILNI